METALRFLRAQQSHWTQAHVAMDGALMHEESLDSLKRSDAAQFKLGLSGTAKSQKDLFESGLSLQEEHRLLEKQLEIMTTRLAVNPGLQRVFVLRDGQPLQSYPLGYYPLRAYGGVAPTLPQVTRIVSKERFAHPERGKAEMANGQLQWTPPQVGTSVRARALGEFVMFTTSKLILHGPPISEEAHAQFPHICLGLSADTARRLYRASFIGTHIQTTQALIEAQPIPSTGTPSAFPPPEAPHG